MSNKLSTDISITIGGEAGQGGRAAAGIIAKAFSKAGYWTFVHEDYQSLIRGGHNFAMVRIADKEVSTFREGTDFLIALNEEAVSKHESVLDEDSIIMYDPDSIEVNKDNAIGVHASRIAKEAGGEEIMANTAMVSALLRSTDIDSEFLESTLKEEFLEESAETNIKIAKKAFEDFEPILHLESLQKESRTTLITGNQAAAIGAAKAGMSTYFAYPMTPSTGILHFLADNADELGVAVSQPENEISVIHMALGAAYSGSRTMIGTSGGGFALMTEALSMAVMSELPLLLVESQRMSPASGVPTYNGQGDLLFTLNAGHGDIVKFMAAPADAEESCLLANTLMNLSWKYQTPSILLTDKQVSESSYEMKEETLEKTGFEKVEEVNEDGEYSRYKISENGVSPLAFPGRVESSVKSNSYEHDEKGITIEESDEVVQMQEKRMLKFQKMAEEVENMESAVKVFGNKNAKKAVLTWGSAKAPAKEAIEKLEDFKMIQVVMLQPFPVRQVSEELKGVEELTTIEANSLGQMSEVLRCNGIYPDQEMLKYDARPFTPKEIAENLKE